MVNGYYRIFVDTNANLIQKNAGRQSDDPEGKALLRNYFGTTLSPNRCLTTLKA